MHVSVYVRVVYLSKKSGKTQPVLEEIPVGIKETRRSRGY